VLNKFLVYFIDLEILAFNLHLSTLEFFYKSLEFSGIILIERARNTMMFSLEGKNGVKNHMKLLWDSEFVPTGNRHFSTVRGIRISETFF
jgi:hypothetical protein